MTPEHYLQRLEQLGIKRGALADGFGPEIPSTNPGPEPELEPPPPQPSQPQERRRQRNGLRAIAGGF